MEEVRLEKKGIYSLNEITLSFSLSRQAFYQWQKRSKALEVEEKVILDLVKAERRLQPRIGTRKLLNRRLKGTFRDLGIKIGRDKFFGILRKNGLLITPKRSYVRTTDSFHYFRVYTNLIKDKVIDRPHLVMASDITYIRTLEGFMYLALITDLGSRNIIGYDLSESLAIEGSLRALKMALRQRDRTKKMIHHSDRGIQYCSHKYIETLKENNVLISMAEKGNPYENAIAERVNGILKTEYMLDETFNSKADALRAVREAIWMYNNLRPHLSLGYRTPEEVHQGGLRDAA
ncbi:MAG: IS3 family transposase [Acidobacteriota bacterium]